MRVFPILLLVLASCSSRPASESLCTVAASPERFVGVPLTISGMAKMSRHGSTLSDPACPSQLLGLDGLDTKFFSSLASTLAPDSGSLRVTVTGQVARNSGVPSHVFQVTTGVVQ